MNNVFLQCNTESDVPLMQCQYSMLAMYGSYSIFCVRTAYSIQSSELCLKIYVDDKLNEPGGSGITMVVMLMTS